MTKLNTRTGLAALLSLGAALAGTTALAQDVTLRIASVNPPTALSVQIAEQVAERVTERTEGRIAFQVFPSAQLGTTTDSLEQASQGQPVITFTSASFMSQFGVPELAAVEGPFVIENAEEGERLASSDLMTGYYDQLAEESGIRVLALNWFDGARHMIGKEPYVEPTDLEGVRMRVPPVETWLKTFEPLGVVATTVEAAETYSALAQGVVEAAEAPITGLSASKWYEAAQEITLTGHFNLFLGWVTSEEVMQSLSEEDYAILVEEFRRGGRELTEQSIELETSIREEFEAAGVTFHDANIAAYRDATASFWDAWPEGFYDELRAAAGE
ncbi:C4-dicarboxylate transport system substrate-binding protein [Oceanicola granulosus HTCC2516]|uniref:C4-dicarboxylate transport system substrate-binding protein n=1 Tax=Oceanicola granulosus (strain ATCC BAA-861 / DSM 15982 / KCTC 12143 / HTCC2516) TaxID=314256 RepID=Q2CF68_OCEGH|nr:TRAP transporter substrate-binding protein DctP [Oceanicola granulosus]EAR51259.1 C4-dicarboxylate transport system substrate-binding protein [Oceanicola granulosus HTCC2516]